MTRQGSRPVSIERSRAFGRALRRWFRVSHRDLPWRRTRDPYHVLVSELMLQQTQVARVVEYYDAFLARFPSLAALAQAPAAAVRESWNGLGYYARARNLHTLAQTLASDGAPNSVIPSGIDALQALPGIGPYTAGAVASFAYERRAALVDTNVARVLQRVFLPRTNVKSGAGQRRVWALARTLLPRTGRATWVHNQALMELGALVCTARVMRCGECPVRGVCATFRDGQSPTTRGSGRRTRPTDDSAATTIRTPVSRPTPTRTRTK
jgi:A/G-specific adenine glycosylase